MPNICVPANGEAVASPAHLRIVIMRRTVLEAHIEEMISLLDRLDGDENLEPYLADTYPSDDDLEEDDEREPEEADENGDEKDSSRSEDDNCYGGLFVAGGFEGGHGV